jgi:hypothetical protein
VVDLGCRWLGLILVLDIKLLCAVGREKTCLLGIDCSKSRYDVGYIVEERLPRTYPFLDVYTIVLYHLAVLDLTNVY